MSERANENIFRFFSFLHVKYLIFSNVTDEELKEMSDRMSYGVLVGSKKTNNQCLFRKSAYIYIDTIGELKR